MFAFRSLSLGALVLSLAGPAPGQEWGRFRGPNGSGIGKADLPARWDEKDINWKVKLAGVGHSSPVLAGDRIFITSGDEKTGRRIVECLAVEDGKVLWSRTFPGPTHRKHRDNSYASATPAVDGRHVYLCWGSPEDFLVVALDHDGKEVWRTDLGPYKGGHGFGASPVVAEGVVVVPNDQAGMSSLVGLDAGTGEQVWKVPRKSKAAYGTPCILRREGAGAEAIFTSWEHGVTAVEVKTGKVTWEADVFAKGHVETPIGSPVLAGGLVLATCGWLGVRQEVVAVRPPAAGKGRAEVVYTLDRSAPLCTTPLVVGGLVFLWSDGGTVTCADAATGKVHWRRRVPGSYYSSPVCVGGKLYNVSRQGDVVVLAAAKSYRLLARNRLDEGSHSTPAVAGGRMYVRTFGHLISVGGR
jgi:outer membrane protein assembly factor BamB